MPRRLFSRNSLIIFYLLTCFSLIQAQSTTVENKDLGGKIYSGEMLDGQPHGKGEILYQRFFDRYVGEFVDGKRSGEGTYYYWSGEVYKGGWKDNLQNGKGVITRIATGTIIEGNYANGRMNGLVKYTYKNGETREGNFTRGRRNGKFRHTYANGRIIELEFVNNEVQGDTVIIAAGNGPLPDAGKFVISMAYNRGKYTGDLHNGLPHGKGRFEAHNNAIYEGEWQNGEYWGSGFLYLASGSRLKGEWVNGKLEGKGHYVWKNGATYNGEWRNGKKHGFGKYRTAAGAAGEGNFQADKRHGEFKVTRADGSIHQTIYADDNVVSSTMVAGPPAEENPAEVTETPETETNTTVIAENETEETTPENTSERESTRRVATNEVEETAPENTTAASIPEPPLLTGPVGFYQNYLRFLVQGYQIPRFQEWLREIGHTMPHPEQMMQQAFVSRKNGVELLWSNNVLEKIIFEKKELPRSSKIRKHMNQHSFDDYKAAGIRQNGRIERSLYWRNGDESIFIEFKRGGNTKKKKAEKVTLEMRNIGPLKLKLYVESAKGELTHDHFKTLITMPFNSIPVQYWLKQSPKPFRKSSSGRTWTYTQEELGISIGYINWGGNRKRQPREPFGQMIAENVMINPSKFKGKLPGGLTAAEIDSLLAIYDEAELNKYYTRITGQSYDEYGGTRKDFLLVPVNDDGILWLEYRNDKLVRVNYDNLSYKAMQAKIKGEKDRATNFIWKKRSEAVASAREADLRKSERQAMAGDETVGFPWRGGRFIPFINENRVNLNKPPHGQGVWVYKEISYRGFFLHGWMEREFTIKDKHGNVGKGKMRGKSPVGKWIVTQNGQPITYYFTNDGQVLDAQIGGKSLMKEGVSDRVVYYELIYRAVQRRSDNSIVQRAPDDYGGDDLHLKIAELSYSSLLSDERRINNNLNFNLLESKLYLETSGSCSCNDYYSWGGWELLSCRKLDYEPRNVDITYDTCSGWYLPDEFTPFWVR